MNAGKFGGNELVSALRTELWRNPVGAIEGEFRHLAGRSQCDERNKALNFQQTGLAGMVQGPFLGSAYLIACPHYLHLGWVGVVATPRYLHILDFVAGRTTLDICGDDNRREEKEKELR